MTARPSATAVVRGGLLAVHAHPDDETLSTGALLASWAASGERATVVTCTRGERGEVIALPGTTSQGLAALEGDGPALAAHRETELARATAALGVEQLFLDEWHDGVAHDGGRRYEDSGMEWVRPGVAGPAADSPPSAFARVPPDEAAGRLAHLIRAHRPAVVATYEPGGGYGHPDHVRAHDVTVRALDLLAARGEQAPELWCAVAPAHEVRAARRALAGSAQARAVAVAHGLTFPDPGEPLPPFAREELPATAVRVDVEPVADRVLAAMRAHATQVRHATSLRAPGLLGCYALSNGVLAPLPQHETYLVARR